MTATSLDINQTIAEVESLLEADENMSPTLTASIKMLIVVVKLLTDKVTLNSRNSSKPPARQRSQSREETSP